MSEFTEEEAAVLKELAKDRMAVSRVVRIVKNVVLTLAALITGYYVIVESGVNWLRVKIGG